MINSRFTGTTRAISSGGLNIFFRQQNGPFVHRHRGFLLTGKLERSVVSLVLQYQLPEMSSVHGIKCSWNFDNTTEDDINSRTSELVKKCRAVYDEIGELNFEQVTFENVIKKLADVDCEFSTYRSPLEFPQHVSTRKELRNASTAASQKLEEFDVEMSMRKDIFDKLVYFQEKNKHKMDSLQPEAKRYVERLIKLGKRNGLHLPHQVQLTIMGLKKRMSELSINFQANLNEDNTTLEFTEKELEGLPEDFIQSLEKLDNGKRRVTMKYPHFFPIVRKCQIAQTRFTVEKTYHSRCMTENVPILEELIKLRQQRADLLGYPTHSAYITEMRMAKTAETVAKFLDDLKVKLFPLWEKEKKIMLDFKKRECDALGLDFDGELHYWDFRYYMAMVEEQLYAVDQNKLKEYFPLHVVTEGLLDIYQQLLGLTFEEMKNDGAWHPDVQMYSVKDAMSKELLGYFFLDLFPRDGKYGHAAVFKLQVGCLGADNQRQLMVAAMLANFTKPTQDKPSLLDHKEVETYFHEFGHVMHQICARAQYAMFSGTKVERDFVEAPSQMLENWVWEPEPLKRMSSHYKTNDPLPDDMIEKLVLSQKANAGIFNLRQVILAKFDQMIHTVGEANTQKLFSKLFQEIVGIPAIEGTNMAATFGHLAGGYDAQYYGYLWSEVYSCDMFASRFKKEGIMSAGVGRDYRCAILEPGGSLDAEVMLENFLGRLPTQDAFLESKGIGVNS